VQKIHQYGDFKHPFLKVADTLDNADITFANLENPFSDRIKPPYEGMSFLCPTQGIEGLLYAGIDIVGLANNHSTDFGNEVFSDTLDVLSKNNIKYCGGGENQEEASEPAILEIKGKKIAFLNYNSIIGGIEAGENNPGINWIRIKPWAEEDNQQDIDRMKKQVSTAKEQVDLVIVCFHWGVEYTLDPIDS
jgi:poly-gamma-glutamate synthesis protein (capsule biosynthesis protein)